MSSGEKFFVGVDDGHSETKIVLPNGRRFRIPSQAVAGKVNRISIKEDAQSVETYKTPDGIYSVGNLSHFEPTNHADYPVSSLNRVIVAHALRQADLPAGAELAICTGLPLKRFYMGSSPNKRLIQSKMENLLRNDVTLMDDSTVGFVIKEHRVFSEGVGAWVDFIMSRDSKGNIVIDPDLLKKRVAVIDLGGRTLDVAVVSNWELDAERSGTYDIGMLSIRNVISEAIYAEHEVMLTEEQMVELLKTRRFKMYGREVDASAYLKDAEQQVVNSAKAQVSRLLGKASDIDHVLFVGGTSAYLEPYLEGWFPHQSLVEDPAFANARGFSKFIQAIAKG